MMKPNVRSAGNLLELCYELPHRIHTSKVYPLRSPNGSTIILCGHEHGLLVLWRGGRPFKPKPREPDPRPAKTSSKFEVMIIDSDDEEPVQPYQKTPDFEEEEEEHDPSEPYSPIIQTLEVPIGIEVLHISFPNLPPKLDHSMMKSLPSLLSEKIVVALGCSDAKIRVLTLALMPPPPHNNIAPKIQVKNKLKNTKHDQCKEQIIELSGHNSLPRGVCITITTLTSHTDGDASLVDSHMDEDGKSSQHQSHYGSQGRAQTEFPEIDDEWGLLVASHSADLSGVLLIHRIPITRGGSRIETKQEHANPCHFYQLTSPATCISFNTPFYPAPQHSEVLITDAEGTIRVLNCLAQHAANSDGLWLVSLYSPFKASSDSVNKRKYAISAQWCLNGKAIIVLYADGEWGIWDIGNAGSKAEKWPEASRDASAMALTAFHSCGWIRPPIPPKNPVKASVDKGTDRTGLAPMTPGTRKARQDVLFAGSVAQSRDRIQGGVSVYPMFDEFNNKAIDETALLWYEGITVVLPSLLACWQSKVRGPGIFSRKEARAQTKQVSNAHLKGEVLNEVCLIPELSFFNHTPIETMKREILFAGEHRIVIGSSPTARSDVQASGKLNIHPSEDQILLAAGELDVHGMDRMLTSMSNGTE